MDDDKTPKPGSCPASVFCCYGVLLLRRFVIVLFCCLGVLLPDALSADALMVGSGVDQ
ncbi:MAG: hypothetical protein FWH33_05250 [Oscillospiraceae bacterium]|nr:hypothetical protein [Oscillospiraceae bacterium]